MRITFTIEGFEGSFDIDASRFGGLAPNEIRALVVKRMASAAESAHEPPSEGAAEELRAKVARLEADNGAAYLRGRKDATDEHARLIAAFDAWKAYAETLVEARRYKYTTKEMHRKIESAVAHLRALGEEPSR